MRTSSTRRTLIAALLLAIPLTLHAQSSANGAADTQAGVVGTPAPVRPPALEGEPADPEQRALPAIEERPLGLTEERAGGAGDVMSSGQWLRTAGALGAVLALLFLLRWVMVRASRRAGLAGALGAGGRAPSGVLSVLGRYPIARGRALVLLQVDTRVLLLDQGAGGFRTLCAITDADEVASILTKTRDEEGASRAARFNGLLRDMERDPATAQGEAIDPGEDLRARVRRIREMGL